MRMGTLIQELLREKKYGEAVDLLKKHLLEGSIIDPKDDHQWAPYANMVGGVIAADLGLDAGVVFWKELASFFQRDIEPVWGRVHKGHIFFHEGLTEARRSIDAAKQAFEAAYDEDCRTEALKGGTSQEVDHRVQRYSAHIALALLERISDADLVEPAQRVHFWEILFATSYDAALQGKIVEPNSVGQALAKLAVHEMRDAILSRYMELDTACAHGMPFSVVTAAGMVLEANWRRHGYLHQRGDPQVESGSSGMFVSNSDARFSFQGGSTCSPSHAP
jgi:hypothetical protein